VKAIGWREIAITTLGLLGIALACAVAALVQWVAMEP
jgi:hypothetical protein